MKKIFLLVVITILSSCKTNQTSVLVLNEYDKVKNITTLTLMPYGNIVIPNEWKKTSYDQTNKQHYFDNGDLTTISVAKNLKEKYPFFKSGQTDKEFVNEFVKWDSEYWKEQGMEIKIIENNPENNFIVWNAKNSNGVNTFFVFGAKNNFVFNYSGYSKKWKDDELVEFLKNLYNTN